MIIFIVVAVLAILATCADALTTQIGISRGMSESNTLLGGPHPRRLIIWLPNLAVTGAIIGFSVWLTTAGVTAPGAAIFPGILALIHGVCAYSNWQKIR